MRKVYLTVLGILISVLLVSCGETAEDQSTEKADVSADTSAFSAHPEDEGGKEDSASVDEKFEAASAEPEDDLAEPEDVYTISIDRESGFYQTDITVHVTYADAFDGVTTVYYTLDGQDPTTESEQYTDGILLQQTGALQVIPLKVLVLSEKHGEFTARNETRTYVLQPYGSAFPDINLVSLTINEDSLYNYYYGIFVSGYTADENESYKNGYQLGNYNLRTDDWMRLADMSFFGADGTLLMEDHIGLGVSGNSSASMSIKSLKIGAKALYLSENKLNYAFDTSVTSADYSFVENFASLKLRSGSQDMVKGNIRSSVVSRLAEESGFDGFSHTARCLVFLNGQPYGLFDLEETEADGTIADRHGLPENQIETYDLMEEVTFRSVLGCDDLFTADLNVKENRDALEEVVDMDNYLLYYAIQILINNTDWPDNNYLIWRYTGEEIPGNSYSDGRFRFFIYDTDCAYASALLGEAFEGATGDTLRNLLDGTSRGTRSYFSQVMKSSVYRSKFLTYLRDLEAGPFSAEHVEEIIREENQKISGARSFLASALDNSFSSAYSDAYVEDMVTSAGNRADQIRNILAQYYGIYDTELVDCVIDAKEGVSLQFSNQTLYQGEEHRNTYYASAPFEITATAYPGYTFSYFMVNGEKIEESTFTFDPSAYAGEQPVRIRAVAERTSDASLVIDAVSSWEEYDYIDLYNAGTETVDLSDYALSDRENAAAAYALPEKKLAPGETIRIYGKKNPDASDTDPVCGFSVGTDETVCLFSGDEMLDHVRVPKTDEDECYARIDHSSLWKFRKETEEEK